MKAGGPVFYAFCNLGRWLPYKTALGGEQEFTYLSHSHMAFTLCNVGLELVAVEEWWQLAFRKEISDYRLNFS